MTDREPYQAPADPELVSTVDVAENSFVTYSGSDGPFYSSLGPTGPTGPTGPN